MVYLYVVSLVGIIGGKTVGVSNKANVYGVKVLNAQGQGSDMEVIHGLNFVYEWHKKHNLPTAVSMSLGGVCATVEQCEDDLIVKLVEKLSKAGISVIVAAGNSDCDACLQTPAFAPSAITVWHDEYSL